MQTFSHATTCCSCYFEWYWRIMLKLNHILKKWRSKKRKTGSKTNRTRKDKCSTVVRCKMLCSETLHLWKISKSTWLVTWETAEKNWHHISFHFHFILHVKIAQYSFWQKTLNKAFPGSAEVIKDGYMLKCKNFNEHFKETLKNNVLYKTTTPHVYQNMNIVL